MQTQIDISNDSRGLCRLRNACDTAKRLLSSMTEAKISISFLTQAHDFELILTRDNFEQICKPFFERLLPPVTRALEDAKIQKAAIDEIVMVGGCTYIPIVRDIIKKYFGKPLNHSVNPDEVVCQGAAI